MLPDNDCVTFSSIGTSVFSGATSGLSQDSVVSSMVSSGCSYEDCIR